MGNNIYGISKIDVDQFSTLVTGLQDNKNNKLDVIIINTLSKTEQTCLIPGTCCITEENDKINNLLKNNRSFKIIIYGKNHSDITIYNKYNTLKKLGFTHVHIYIGGLFEWLCLREIYSHENFPISGDNVIDIYKYRPINIKN